MQTLTVLELQENQIQDEGAISLASALAKNTVRKHLHLYVAVEQTIELRQYDHSSRRNRLSENLKCTFRVRIDLFSN